MKKYVMTSKTYFANKSYTFYGIALFVEEKGRLEVLEEYSCLTNDKLRVKHFVKLCNKLKLQQSDFLNVIEDFVVSAGEH
ncbi:MAG: hypothetical protein IJX51_01700 [Clostridia bacterium]|nr:hypothetical protein [Clostridia bacterium]